MKKKTHIFVLDNLIMNEEYNKLINKLNENIQKLMLLYSSEKEKNNKLSEEVNNLNNELNIYKAKYQEIERKYDNLKMARSLDGDTPDEREARLKLNRIIREIDNCIALLNK
ncbi:MAG: hypothetical protein PHE56_11570 [Bacteroidales bacterium]|nr:hypothetical protein [Bacteroidales bacterium]